jgi:hypothetical protein
MRVHERLGARMGPLLRRSLRITGRVADREAWTGLELPISGMYVFPTVSLCSITHDAMQLTCAVNLRAMQSGSCSVDESHERREEHRR